MKRLFPLMLLALVLSGLSSAAAETNRPNILWLISEDMGPEALSRAGTPQVWTPNLDRLASQGVYYTHAYVGMVCSVSRSSFMTGNHPTPMKFTTWPRPKSQPIGRS